jgi:renalase
MLPPRIAIIGAGLTGIAAARHLRALGLAPTLYEKSRGYGGRCATKRWQDCRIDHGAQYFTLRDSAFREAVQTHSGDQVLTLTSPIVDATLTPLPSADRYYHRAGNSRLVRDLAADLDVRLETPIIPLCQHGGCWTLAGETYDHVLSTAPLPQTLHLFNQPLAADPFIPCLALLLRYAGDAPGLTAQRYAVSAPRRAGARLVRLRESQARPHPSGQHLPSGSRQRSLQPQPPGGPTRGLGPAAAGRGGAPLGVDRLPTPGPAPAPLALRPRRQRHPCPALPPGLHHASDALIKSRVESAWLAGHTAAATLAAML